MRATRRMRRICSLILAMLYTACAAPAKLPVPGHAVAIAMGGYLKTSPADGVTAVKVTGPARVFVIRDYQVLSSPETAPGAGFPSEVPISIPNDGTRSTIFVIVLPLPVSSAQELGGKCYANDGSESCKLCIACMKCSSCMGCCLPPPSATLPDAGVTVPGTPMPGAPGGH